MIADSSFLSARCNKISLLGESGAIRVENTFKVHESHERIFKKRKKKNAEGNRGEKKSLLGEEKNSLEEIKVC